MVRTLLRVATLLGTLVAGGALALAVDAAAGASPTTVTIGNTSGTPSTNTSCAGNCTFVPFSGVATPALVAPFDGTVTGFSVNAGSAGGTVQLRVLRPVGSSGQFTGVGTSGTETLATGINNFTVSMPVKTGDLVGLDNGTGALIFDNTNTTPITAFYQLPPLADGATAAPNQRANGARLLLSATIQQSPTATTTSSTTTVTTTTTVTRTTAPPVPPQITAASLSAPRFRVAGAATALSAKVPLGTSFRFTLSAAATVHVAITHAGRGRRSGGRCVAPTAALRAAHARSCTRAVADGTLTRAAETAGRDSVAFSGRLGTRALGAGRHVATLTANNANGRSRRVTLSFVVVSS